MQRSAVMIAASGGIALALHAAPALAQASQTGQAQPREHHVLPAPNGRNGVPHVNPSAAWQDRNDLQRVTIGTLKASSLLDAHVYGANNKDVGGVSDLVLDPNGRLKSFIVDVGGFLGIGDKPIEVRMSSAEIRRDTSSGTLAIFTNVTRKQLESRKPYRR